MDSIREGFENTFQCQYSDFERFGNGEYMDDFLQQSWLGWQASRQEFDVQKECWRHEAEDLEALHRNLDDAGVPLHENGAELSAWGRVLRTNQNSASIVVPRGWKLVPTETTQWMRTQGEEGFENCSVIETWARMLRAAPTHACESDVTGDGEPVAIVDRVGIMQRCAPYTNLDEGTKLYTHPADSGDK